MLTMDLGSQKGGYLPPGIDDKMFRLYFSATRSSGMPLDIASVRYYISVIQWIVSSDMS
jgi:hypothetical protein